MKAVWIEDGRISVRDVPEPAGVAGETRIRVEAAGVCATDLALAAGYMAFRGTPGHEFVGTALEGPHEGRRVVGEINAGCGACEACESGLERHCPRRTVLGILNRPGAFAEMTRLPERNLHPLPDELPNDAAVFAEPLAAAFEMAEQVPLDAMRDVLVAGDGRLGLLCAHVLASRGLAVTVAGHHPERRRLLPEGTAFETSLLESDRPWFETPPEDVRWDLGVEATGRPEVLARLIPRIRPRGTVILKTTSDRAFPFDSSAAVVNEISLVGSRCGPFAPALEALASGAVPVGSFVSRRYPLEAAVEAFGAAAEPGVLKVLLDY